MTPIFTASSEICAYEDPVAAAHNKAADPRII